MQIVSIPTNNQGFRNAILSKRCTVINIKSADCTPCQHAYARYEKLVEGYAERTDLQFGCIVIDSKNKDFIINELGIKKIPTFDVYMDGKLVHRGKSPDQAMVDLYNIL